MSVVEVLVALMLVTIGLLGIAGSTALALRATLDATQRRAAAVRVASRFARLSAAGCAAASGGTATDPHHLISETWTVAPAGPHFATISDSVAWMSPRGAQSLALRSAIPC